MPYYGRYFMHNGISGGVQLVGEQKSVCHLKYSICLIPLPIYEVSVLRNWFEPSCYVSYEPELRKGLFIQLIPGGICKIMLKNLTKKLTSKQIRKCHQQSHLAPQFQQLSRDRWILSAVWATLMAVLWLFSNLYQKRTNRT